MRFFPPPPTIGVRCAKSVAVALSALIGTSVFLPASSNAITVSRVILEHVDYANGQGICTFFGQSYPTGIPSYGGLFAKVNGSATGLVPYGVSWTSNHAYIKIRIDVATATDETMPSSFTFKRRHVWSTNTDHGASSGGVSVGVSFNGAPAIGGSGDTGYLYDTLSTSFSPTLFSHTISVGADGGGYALSGHIAMFGQADFVYELYP